MLTDKDFRRLVSKIVIGTVVYDGVDTVCYELLGKWDARGYSRFWWNGQWRQGHRITWQYMNEDFTIRSEPQYFEESKPTIDHRCNNRGCVRPSHLQPCSLKHNHELRAQRYWALKKKREEEEVI